MVQTCNPSPQGTGGSKVIEDSLASVRDPVYKRKWGRGYVKKSYIANGILRKAGIVFEFTNVTRHFTFWWNCLVSKCFSHTYGGSREVELHACGHTTSGLKAQA